MHCNGCNVLFYGNHIALISKWKVRLNKTPFFIFVYKCLNILNDKIIMWYVLTEVIKCNGELRVKKTLKSIINAFIFEVILFYLLRNTTYLFEICQSNSEQMFNLFFSWSMPGDDRKWCRLSGSDNLTFQGGNIIMNLMIFLNKAFEN